MSVNYAAGLSPYAHKGKCGLPEIFDSDDVVDTKCEQLARIILDSKHLVVHTGAGVSTAAGIPDFRGPKGVWTLEAKGEAPNVNVTFDEAAPSLTHMGLVGLEKAGILKLLITQNIDGLHMRSGFPRDRLAELHGNMFLERCDTCARDYVQSACVPTIGLKYTGKSCVNNKSNGRPCRGKLRDVVLDWEDNLPEKDLTIAEHHSKLADVSLCLGTTLQIVPAGNLPLHAKCRGKLVIVNLQKTKHHNKADLVIHARVDRVIDKVMQILNIQCPQFHQFTIVENSGNQPAESPSANVKRKPTKRKKDNPNQETVPECKLIRDNNIHQLDDPQPKIDSIKHDLESSEMRQSDNANLELNDVKVVPVDIKQH